MVEKVKNSRTRTAEERKAQNLGFDEEKKRKV